jgi:hypothetical protein
MKRTLLAALLLTALPALAGTGRMIILNLDAAGVGMNDPTPVAPIGGNTATTLGAQRFAALQAAANKWQSVLDTDVDILVNASFTSIAGCSETSGVLAQAAPVTWMHSFNGAPRANVWYPISLANKLTGTDLDPGRSDIFVQFNLDVDNASCFGATNFYYGLDGNHGDDIDVFVVALHELGHGLGIAGADRAPAFAQGRPAIADTFRYDETLGRRWDQMTEAERSVSVTNNGKLVWDGPQVRSAASQLLASMTALTVTAPSAIARNYEIGTASFGVPATMARVGGQIVQAIDESNAAGPATSDGCTALSNAGALAGNIALVDRGTCTFLAKARNAQAAGAIAVVVVDNVRTACIPPGMSATDDASDVHIPVVSIRTVDGDAIRGQSGSGVSALLQNDPVQRAGASPEGRVRLYAPCTVEAGSSTNHWDVTASPNLLMEPNISSDLIHGVDLTLYQLMDMGWTAQPKTGRRLLKR